jgi:hypothetical protein
MSGRSAALAAFLVPAPVAGWEAGGEAIEISGSILGKNVDGNFCTGKMCTHFPCSRI